jgi:hypothetical protein
MFFARVLAAESSPQVSSMKRSSRSVPTGGSRSFSSRSEKKRASLSRQDSYVL